MVELRGTGLLWGKTMLSKVVFFKSESGAVPTPPAFNVFISPSSYDNSVNKGSFTTPTFTANVTGGTGPFDYQWTCTSGTVLSPTSQSTKVTLSGYNITRNETLTMTVTDATLAEAVGTASIIIEFGS